MKGRPIGLIAASFVFAATVFAILLSAKYNTILISKKGLANKYRTEGLFELKDFESGRVNFPQQAMRGLNQVKKSADTNIGIDDHVWEHQTGHTASYSGISAPPLGAGFKSKDGKVLARRLQPAKKQQLFSLDDFNNGNIVFPEINTADRTPPTGHFTARNGDSDEWPVSTAGM
mmetsp:Transcript_71105/g.189766  ORF Transcript_71105/g.189766 Transcript_71105/m.189766 type:complete len:174 (+) Transcript_71105:132-653(+)